MRIEATDSGNDANRRRERNDARIGPSKGRLNRRKRANLAASFCKFLEVISWIGLAAVPLTLVLHWTEHPSTPPLPPGMTVDVIKETSRGENYVDLARYSGWDPEPYVFTTEHEPVAYVGQIRERVQFSCQDAPIVSGVSFLLASISALHWALFFRQMGRFLRSLSGRHAFKEDATLALRRASRLLFSLAPITAFAPVAIVHFGSGPLTSLLRENGHRVAGVSFPRDLHPMDVPELFLPMVLCAAFLALLARIFREGEVFEQLAQDVV